MREPDNGGKTAKIALCFITYLVNGKFGRQLVEIYAASLSGRRQAGLRHRDLTPYDKELHPTTCGHVALPYAAASSTRASNRRHVYRAHFERVSSIVNPNCY